MNAMKKRIRTLNLNQQEGAALIIAVMTLLILTVIGIYAVTTSTMETKITGFEKTFKEAFYAADSGNPMGIELIKTIIHDVPGAISNLPDPWKASKDLGITHVADSSLLTEIFSNPADPTAPRPFLDDIDIDSRKDSATPDLGLPSSVRLKVDIDRLGSHQISGGALKFASGYEGIGSGGGGSVGVIYAIDSLGQSTFSNAESSIEAGYLYMVGVPGGE